MSSNLSRRFSSTIVRSDLSSSVTRRLVCMTNQFFQSERKESDEKDEIRINETEKHNDPKAEGTESDSDDADVNKLTGEIGGPRGPEPTRYGDWEKGGRCCDF